MSRLVALGERRRIEGFALAGVELLAAEGGEEARSAWLRLGPDVGVVFLTPAAHDAILDLLPSRPEVIWTMLPE